MLAPFSSTGVDYFRPFLVKVERSRVKCWGCLHVHGYANGARLDLPLFTIDLLVQTTGLTDNGTNMTGAEKELKTSEDDE